MAIYFEYDLEVNGISLSAVHKQTKRLYDVNITPELIKDKKINFSVTHILSLLKKSLSLNTAHQFFDLYLIEDILKVRYEDDIINECITLDLKEKVKSTSVTNTYVVNVYGDAKMLTGSKVPLTLTNGDVPKFTNNDAGETDFNEVINMASQNVGNTSDKLLTELMRKMINIDKRIKVLETKINLSSSMK